MTEQEHQQQQLRSERYIKLKQLERHAVQAIDALRRDRPEGPHNKGPYTGNTRESRIILSMTINFSRTDGGAPEVQDTLENLNISAYSFANAIQGLLGDRLIMIREELEKL